MFFYIYLKISLKFYINNFIDLADKFDVYILLGLFNLFDFCSRIFIYISNHKNTIM